MENEKMEWVVLLPEHLQIDFNRKINEEEEPLGVQLLTEEIVDRFDGFKIEVFSREHPPPHFRVKKNGETANYRVANCVQINGGLRKYYRKIKKWFNDNKEEVINAWDKMRPTGCPVGEYIKGGQK